MDSRYYFQTEGMNAILTFLAKIVRSKAPERDPQHDEPLKQNLAELYSENIAAKVLRAAMDHLVENVNDHHSKN